MWAWLMTGGLCGVLPAKLAADCGPTMGLNELAAGQRGYGLTVFRGTTPERFAVEVVGVLHDFLPDQGLILVRTTHPVLQRAKGVAGMSGSPIYIQDRLIGAYAYGWAFAEEAIVGVTPIESMLELLDPRAHRPASVPNETALAHWLNAGVALPAGTGFAARPLPLARTQSGSELAPPIRSLGPGSALSINLIEGDLSAAATGTVTCRDGDRLLAFGHPMFGAGAVALPAAGARIVHIFASAQRSFKLSEAGPASGRLSLDTQPGILTTPEPAPQSRFEVRLPDGPGKRVWKLKLAQSPVLLPGLVVSALGQILRRHYGDGGPGAFQVRSGLRLNKGPLHARDEWLTMRADEGLDTALRSAFLVRALRLAREVTAAVPTELHFELRRALPADRACVLERAYPATPLQRAGGELRLDLRLRADGQPARTETLRTTLPEALPAGLYRLHLESAPTRPGLLPAVRSLASLEARLQAEAPRDALTLSLGTPLPGLLGPGQRLDAVPESRVEALADRRASHAKQRTRSWWQVQLPLSCVPRGALALDLQVADVTEQEVY